MTDASESWHELREILDGPREEIAFRALVGLLDTWPGNDVDAAIALAEERLAAWPDAVRIAPWSWVAALVAGVRKPTWRLVRGYARASGHRGRKGFTFEALADRAELRAISDLRLSRWSWEAKVEFPEFLRSAETFDALKSVRFWPVPGSDLKALQDAATWSRLDELHVGSPKEEGFHFEATRFAPTLPDGAPLRRVTMQADDLADLWQRVSLPRLVHASLAFSSVEEAQRLASRPELARIEGLDLAFRCGRNGGSSMFPWIGNAIPEDDAAVEAFFARADLSNLRSLSIAGYTLAYWSREGMGPAGLAAIARSGLLKQIERLELRCLPLSSDGPGILAEALPHRGLKSLSLIDVWLDDAGAIALAESGRLGDLEELDLGSNRMRGAGAAALAATSMPRLRALNLSGPPSNPYYWNVGDQPIGSDGAAAWADSPNAETIETLALSGCRLRDAGLVALARSRRFRRLTKLELSGDAFASHAIAELARSDAWRSLRHLNLCDTRFDDACASELVRIESASALRTLDLGHSSIGPAGAATLANWPALAHLWKLGLHDAILDDEGLIAIATSPYVGRLLELDLEQDCWNSRNRDFGDAAASALANSTSLRRLDAVFSGCIDEYHGACYSTGFSANGFDELLASPRFRPEVAASLSFLDIDPIESDAEVDADADEDEDDDDDEAEPSVEDPESDRRDHDFRFHARRERDDIDDR